MIAVDTSAVVAIFLREAEHETFARLIDEAEHAYLSVVSRFEVIAVLCGRRIGTERDRVADFIDALGLIHVPVSEDLGHRAVDALFAYGRGRHHAGLNLGDCFSYALAKSLDAPLLFKGDDFTQTDILPAWQP